MELSLRTFCVIPHEARANVLFDAVFEDGVRALYQGRLHPLFFSRVLSPAHDLTGHVVGPLLARVRQGGSAVLIVGLPGGDADDMRSEGVGVVSSEKLVVAMELYAHIIPLLFRSAERCCFARVSVTTFSVKDKKVSDLLQGSDVRSERDAQYQLIERNGSSARWGSVMKLLHERHTRLEAEDSPLQSESVLVVRVELEGYGKVALVEVGCGRETLHQLTLLLRSGGACGAKTYPLRGPLSAALRELTPPAALVHLVGIPDPQHAPCSTMRLLRFLSSMSRNPLVEPVEEDHSSKNSPRRRQQQQQQEQQQQQRLGSGCEGVPREAAVREAEAKAEVTPVLLTSGSQKNYSWGKELFVDPSHCVHSLPGSHNAALTSTWDWGAARPSGLRGNATAKSSSVRPAVGGNSPTNSVESQVSREQALVNRVEVLDRTNRELIEALSLARAEIRHIKALQQSSQEALRQKQDALLSLTASKKKAMEENVDYAKLVPRLLRKVKTLEKERATLRDTSKEFEKKNTEIHELNLRLQSQLERLQKEVRLMTKKETQRLREHALTRIQTTEEGRGGSAKRSSRPTTPGISRATAKSPMLNTSVHFRGGKNARVDKLQELPVCDAIAELQRRNSLLEAEVVALKKKLSAAGGNISAGFGGAISCVGVSGNNVNMCATCDAMRCHLNALTEELDRGSAENERLRRQLTDQSLASLKNAPLVVRDVVCTVAASLIAGCESMRVQLKHLEAEAERREPKDTRLTPVSVFQEHIDALAALEVALQDISGRRYRGAESYESILPTSATAADAELLSSLLLFEVERKNHLRAFVPTFAQLSVATEHLKMRLFSLES